MQLRKQAMPEVLRGAGRGGRASGGGDPLAAIGPDLLRQVFKLLDVSDLKAAALASRPWVEPASKDDDVARQVPGELAAGAVCQGAGGSQGAQQGALAMQMGSLSKEAVHVLPLESPLEQGAPSPAHPGHQRPPAQQFPHHTPACPPAFSTRAEW